eukprot:4128088-Alexandrium_andersonii.AAC.1
MPPRGKRVKLGSRAPVPKDFRGLGSSNCRTCNIASGVRSLNCAGPGAASKLIPEAPEGSVLH